MLTKHCLVLIATLCWRWMQYCDIQLLLNTKPFQIREDDKSPGEYDIVSCLKSSPPRPVSEIWVSLFKNVCTGYVSLRQIFPDNRYKWYQFLGRTSILEIESYIP